jgi:hypothetical protein
MTINDSDRRNRCGADRPQLKHIVDGGGFCANALDAMTRNIPMVVVKVVRKNPEFAFSRFINLIGFEDGRNEDGKRVQNF